MNKKNSLSKGVNRMGPCIALAVIFVVLSLAADSFLTVNNLLNVLRQATVNGFISVGMLLVLITAGIDISVGATAAASMCIMAMMMRSFQISHPAVLIPVCLAAGLVVGLCNGLLLTKLRLPHPFVSTMGMKSILSGVALLVVQTQPVTGFSEGVLWLGKASIFSVGNFSGIPVGFVSLIAVYILIHIMLTKTSFGKQIYCIGGNAEAARMSGINSHRVLIIVYTLCGFMSAIAGLVIVGRGGTANPTSAQSPYDVDAIAACVIGGASFNGGKGTVWGTLIGVMVISVLRNGLVLMNATSDVQYIVIGFVIILSVLIDVVRTRLEERAKIRSSN